MDSWTRQWYDTDLELPETLLRMWRPAEHCHIKIDSLLYDLKVLTWGGQIPRRLGAGATGAALSRDKRWFRRTASLQKQLIDYWARLVDDFVMPPGEPTEFSPQVHMEGAQLDPEIFMSGGITKAIEKRAQVVTIATQLGLESWAAKAANTYSQEIFGLERIQQWYREAS